jgi:hypothetical protein
MHRPQTDPDGANLGRFLTDYPGVYPFFSCKPWVFWRDEDQLLSTELREADNNCQQNRIYTRSRDGTNSARVISITDFVLSTLGA